MGLDFVHAPEIRCRTSPGEARKLQSTQLGKATEFLFFGGLFNTAFRSWHPGERGSTQYVHFPPCSTLFYVQNMWVQGVRVLPSTYRSRRRVEHHRHRHGRARVPGSAVGAEAGRVGARVASADDLHAAHPDAVPKAEAEAQGSPVPIYCAWPPRPRNARSLHLGSTESGFLKE